MQGLALSTVSFSTAWPKTLPGHELPSQVVFMQGRPVSKTLPSHIAESQGCSQALVSNSAHQELTNDQGHCLNALNLLLRAHELPLEAALLLLDVLLLRGGRVECGLVLGAAWVTGHSSGSAQPIVSLQSGLNPVLSCPA